ncbi:MAG: hypothetical protein JSR90_22070 [Proteobacteria bacterium]|nr:hypothetical protein [Pseudomonadota bacterium]
MGNRPTLILTTRLGVRPLGVRGEPLHAVAGQLLAVIRRRLGDGAADLLAEPQLREAGDGIDWYTAANGPVRRLAELDEAERADVLRRVEAHLDAIRGLGTQLAASQTSDEARLVGRSLELATRRPSDDFVFVVDGQPVIAAWGYEADSAASLLPLPTLATPTPQPAVFASAPVLALPARAGWSRWLGALLFGLLLLLLLLIASWLLRACTPVDPSTTVATIETPAPPAPPPPPDPTPVLKASLDEAQAAEKKLKEQLAALQADIKHKVEQCKPVEPPKPPPPPPPPVAKAPPPPPPQQHATAPPVSRPPPGLLPCDWSGDSGGEGVTRNRHYLGDKPGFVAINYNLYVKPDDIKVIYRGQVIAGTGGPRSGRGGFGFDWNPVAGDYSVDVIVTGEMWGTRWTYTMSCPRGGR